MENKTIVIELAKIIGKSELEKVCGILLAKKGLDTKERQFAGIVDILKNYENLQPTYRERAYILRDKYDLVQRGVALYQSGALANYMQDMIDGLDFYKIVA